MNQWDHYLVGATFISHLAYVNLLPESYNFPRPGVTLAKYYELMCMRNIENNVAYQLSLELA